MLVVIPYALLPPAISLIIVCHRCRELSVSIGGEEIFGNETLSGVQSLIRCEAASAAAEGKSVVSDRPNNQQVRIRRTRGARLSV